MTLIREYRASDLVGTYAPGARVAFWPNRLNPGTNDLRQDAIANPCGHSPNMFFVDEGGGVYSVEYNNGRFGFFGTWHDGFGLTAEQSKNFKFSVNMKSTNNANVGVLFGQTGGGVVNQLTGCPGDRSTERGQAGASPIHLSHVAGGESLDARHRRRRPADQ